MNRLNVVSVESSKPESPSSKLKKRREETKAAFDLLWQQNPEQFNPRRNVMERTRMHRTWEIIKQLMPLYEKQVADIGCGYGELTKLLSEHDAFVKSIDISPIALARHENKHYKNVVFSEDYMPRTLLKDDFYDLAVSTDLIAYLPPDEYRLFFSELSRIIKSNGLVIISTPIDIYSVDALDRFASLAETEFKVEKWIFSHHYLYIRFLEFFKFPARIVAASKSPVVYQEEIIARNSISRLWFKINTAMPLSILWRGISFFTNRIALSIEQSKTVLKALEKVTRFFWSDAGISHAIMAGSRRPLMQEVPQNQMPIERKQRKQVWE